MRRGVRIAAVAGVIVLLSSACQRQQGVGAGTASIEITSPVEGATVSVPFEISFDVSGVEIGPTSTGNHHLHVYIDDDYDVHESTDSFNVSVVAPGSHKVRVLVAEANHDETDASDEITVTVAGASGSTPGPQQDRSGYGY